MNRIKLLAISTITTAMIFGSSMAIATSPAEQVADQAIAAPAGVSVLELANPAPAPKRGGGGSGKALKK